MNKRLYTITTLSNLHVGSGDTSYGVIDNLIQRDVLSDFPNINASGLKGSVRQYFEYKKNEKTDIYFGSKYDTEQKSKATLRFFDAHLLSIPVRSDKTPYFMATSIEIIKEFCFRMKIFGFQGDKINKLRELTDLLSCVDDGSPVTTNLQFEGAVIEELSWKAQKTVKLPSINILEEMFGKPTVILSNTDMRTICDNNHLPVIARNHLENGTSANLWYEQVLPRYTRLYFIVIGENDLTDFETCLTQEPIQIGANQSIGYGYCSIKKAEL
jgi:CRISPR-associated protein Cmr4